VRVLSFASKNFSAELAAFCQTASASPEISASVAGILADVRRDGDAAVAYYAAKFDGATLRARDFRVPQSELAAAARSLPSAQRAALRAAHAGILAFHRHPVGIGSRQAAWLGRNPHGAQVGERFYPIRRVGLYVPGGEVPLVSTVLMTATLAKLAGCPEIALFTPCGANGKVAPALLAALHLVGVTEVWRVGGVQAIGAAAYGTATIPAVDKIFGPGSAYVCEAKRQVFGTVGVDSLPGPSELMVICDETARADFAAADLLAQAEHGTGREKIVLAAVGPKVLAAVLAALEAQLQLLTRAEKIRRVLAEGFMAVQVTSLEQAASVANFVAPEHLELLVRPRSEATLLRTITTAGAVMLGGYTPTALGDFVAGPSHVLPTGRAARFSSGLRVEDFLRRTSVVRYDRTSVKRAAPAVAAFAAMEMLDAHGRSVSIRVE